MPFAPLIDPVAALIREVSATTILPRFQHLSADEITDKAADDRVTIADTEAEARLGEGLDRLLPEAALVGEEATHADPTVVERLRSGISWIIDPLDGTNNFAAGRAPFGVLIALAVDGETQAGWIYDCLSGRLCHALHGGGAFVDGERIEARTTGETPPVAGLSTLFMNPAERAVMEAHILPHYRRVDIPRCAAEQYPRLALGVNDIALFARTMPWDHAAGALFLTEAGGMVARLDGRPYRVDQIGDHGLIGAASPALGEALLAQLAAIPAV